MKKNKKILETLFLLILAILFIIIIDQFFFISLSYNKIPPIPSISISVIIMFAIMLFINGCINNIFKTTILMSIIVSIFNIANIIKISYTESPILFSDFNFLNNAGQLFNLINGNLITLVKDIFPMLVLLIIYLLTIIFGSLSVKRTLKLKGICIRFRIVSCGIGILIIAILFIPNNKIKKFMLNNFYNAKETSKLTMVASNIRYYKEYGVIASMYGQMLENRSSKPEKYDDNQLDSLLEKYEKEPTATESSWGTPNIILVFSEAFWDIGQLNDIKFDKAVTSNFNELKKEGIFINLISPSYGGLSANVDFELLTGGSLRYFGFGYVPLEHIYKNKNNKEITSFLNELNNNGYDTKIIFGKDFYQAELEFRKIGFKSYEEVRQVKENTKGQFVSDEYLTDRIINELNNKEKNKKIFYMSETIQNHMPFLKNKYNTYDISIISSDYSEDANNTLLSYAQGIYDADKQLGRLYEYIKEYDEPTIILFLGDHLPYLRTQNRKRYNIRIRIF